MFDYFSEANKAAAQVREIFDAYVRVGFTEAQAMQIILALMGAAK